MTASFQQMVLL
uniref:Uncharacterized protein n=1 Tax=Anguilla anguilla TaxID=7936 RepID=A0A0E9TS62_ANGAN